MIFSLFRRGRIAKMRTATAMMVMILVLPRLAGAQQQVSPGTRPSTLPAQPAQVAGVKVSDKLSVTEHEMKLGDTTLKYKATAGYMVVKDEAGKEKANFFFVAYEKMLADGADKSERPITYVFNGGPGAAA